MKIKELLEFNKYSNGILSEAISTAPLIIVDIQPAYSGIYDGAENPMFEEAIQFVNQHKGRALMFVNAESEGLTTDTISDIKEYWEDSGFDPDNWNKVKIYDKGYGYLRSWMDNNVPERTIIKVIRALYQYKETDSRDIPEDDLKLIVGEDWEDWMIDDPIVVSWLEIDTLKRYSGGYLFGGGRNECLKEVQLMMNAFNLKYTLINDFIYG